MSSVKNMKFTFFMLSIFAILASKFAEEIKTTPEPTTQPTTTHDPTTIPDSTTTSEPMTATPEPTTTTAELTTPTPAPTTTTPEPTTTTSESTTPTPEPSTTPEQTTTTPEPTTTTPEPTTTPVPTTTLPTINLNDLVPYVTWSPTTETLEVIEVALGYKIEVVIEECDLDTAEGEYARISSSEYLDSTDTLQFVYTVSGQPSFLFNTNTIFAYFKGTTNSIFTVNFTLIGEELTTVTTEVSSTTMFLPTSNDTDSDRYTVYLAGINAEDYKKELVQTTLKNAILNMAVEYCNINFVLATDLTIYNIILHQITPCSNTWPDYQNCVILTFGIPIELDLTVKQPYGGYQMNSTHLKQMWQTLSSKYLKNYDVPKAGEYLKWQIILFSGITLAFVVCLVVLRICTVKIAERMRRNSDTVSIVSSEDRKSEISLDPHYLQQTPTIFDSAYSMYNPEADSPYTPNSFEFPDYQEVREERNDITMNDDDSDHLESGA